MKLGSLPVVILLLCTSSVAWKPVSATNGSTNASNSSLVGYTTEGSHSEVEAKHEENSKCGDVEHEEFDSQVRLARVEFRRVETIFVVLMFIMVVVLAKMCK